MRYKDYRPMSATNEDIIRSYIDEVWNLGNLGAVDTLVAADRFDTDGAVDTAAMTVEELTHQVRRLRGAFPDLHVSIEDVAAEGDLVAARLSVRGTHDGVWMGIDPTGQEAMWRGTTVFRVAGGKIVERWGEVDVLCWV